jgi:hypothetical protein
MNGMRRGAVIASFTLGTLVATAATAGATTSKPGVPATPLAASANPPGYLVVESSVISALSGVQTHGSVTCPGTEQPVGGGVFVQSSSTAVNINSSYPSGSSGEADVNNASDSPTVFRVYAECLAHSSSYRVFSQTATAVNGGQSSSGAPCPLRKTLLGGGALSNSLNTAVNINSSLPSGRYWRADINNASGTDTGFVVYAICGVKPLGYSVQAGSPTANPPGAQTHASVACPGSTVPLSGGAYADSGDVSVNLNDAAPDAGGWSVYENNASLSATTVTAWAVCAGI